MIGEAGNEWERRVGRDGVSLNVVVKQRAGTEVAELSFEIAPDGAPWPGSAIRHLPISDTPDVGRNELTVVWDGRDDGGRPVPSGRYHIFAAARTTSERVVECLDGSGQGIERFQGTREGLGVGVLVVD